MSISAKVEVQVKCIEQELWLHKTNEYCYFNRVQPLEKIKQEYKVWVSGVVMWQTTNRSLMSLIEQKPNIIKFHPLLDTDTVA